MLCPFFTTIISLIQLIVFGIVKMKKHIFLEYEQMKYFYRNIQEKG